MLLFSMFIHLLVLKGLLQHGWFFYTFGAYADRKKEKNIEVYCVSTVFKSIWNSLWTVL